MSEQKTTEAEDEEVGIFRIYMKSGNIICLPRVVGVKYQESLSGGSRSIELTQGGPAGGERLLTQSLDLSQVEAMTWENSADA